MANEIVKYNNDLNVFYSFRDFCEYDLNFLMAICAKMKELGEEVQVFEYKKLMELIEWDKTQSINLFHKELMRMAEKLRHVGATLDVDEDTFLSFNLFSEFEGNKRSRTLRVRVNPRFKYILNEINKNFTRFELAEYIKLDGKYSKLLYQNLKQYRRAGWWQVDIDVFRHQLSIPTSMPTRNIISKVINPSIEVIKSCKGFAELQVEVLHSDRRGRKVIGYRFSWTADKQIPGQMNINDLAKSGKDKTRKIKSNYTDIDQRNYDFEELEKLLTNN